MQVSSTPSSLFCAMAKEVLDSAVPEISGDSWSSGPETINGVTIHHHYGNGQFRCSFTYSDTKRFEMIFGNLSTSMADLTKMFRFYWSLIRSLTSKPKPTSFPFLSRQDGPDKKARGFWFESHLAYEDDYDVESYADQYGLLDYETHGAKLCTRGRFIEVVNGPWPRSDYPVETHLMTESPWLKTRDRKVCLRWTNCTDTNNNLELTNEHVALTMRWQNVRYDEYTRIAEYCLATLEDSNAGPIDLDHVWPAL